MLDRVPDRRPEARVVEREAAALLRTVDGRRIRDWLTDDALAPVVGTTPSTDGTVWQPTALQHAPTILRPPPERA